MPDLADFEELVSVGASRTVRLSSSSLAVLFSALDIIGFKHQWRGSEPNGELTESENDRIDNYVDLATFELMVGVAVAEEIGAIKFSIVALSAENLLDITSGGTWLAVDYPELHAGLPSSMKTEDDFTFPDMRGKTIIGAGFDFINPSHQQVWVDAGDVIGELSHAITVGELPRHAHDRQSSGASEQVLGSTGTGSGGYASGSRPVTIQTLTGNVGDNEDINIVQPSFAGYYYVVAK